MKNGVIISLVPLFLLSGNNDHAPALSDPLTTAFEFTVPTEPNMLFYIQRNYNENTIVYALNKDENGSVVNEKPIDIYWKRYQDDGRREELDYIQRTFAYGMRAKDKGDHYDLRCVAYDSTPLYLYKSSIESGKPQVITVMNGRGFILEKIFVQIEGGTFWIPNVKYAELSGTDPRTGEKVHERIMR